MHNLPYGPLFCRPYRRGLCRRSTTTLLACYSNSHDPIGETDHWLASSISPRMLHFWSRARYSEGGAGSPTPHAGSGCRPCQSLGGEDFLVPGDSTAFPASIVVGPLAFHTSTSLVAVTPSTASTSGATPLPGRNLLPPRAWPMLHLRWEVPQRA